MLSLESINTIGDSTNWKIFLQPSSILSRYYSITKLIFDIDIFLIFYKAGFFSP